MFLKMCVEIKPEISFQFPGPKTARKTKRGIDFQIPWAKPGPQLFRAQHFDWARTAIHSVSLWGGWPWPVGLGAVAIVKPLACHGEQSGFKTAVCFQ